MQVPWISLIQLWEPLSIITPPVLQGLNPNLSLASPLTAALPRTFCPEETMKYSLAGGEGRGEGAGGWTRHSAEGCWERSRCAEISRGGGEGGEGGQQGNIASGLYKKQAWVTVSFIRSRSRAAGCGGEGADIAIMGVVGPENGRVWLLVKGRGNKMRLISSRIF